MFLWYYYAAWFDRQSEGGTRWIASVLCRGSRKAMTRISRWTKSLYQWQLNPKSLNDKLPYLLWPPLDPEHQWWFLSVCSKPSLWANQRSQKWSYSCLLSNWLKWVGRSQCLSIHPSTSEWVWAKIEDHHKACALALLISNIYHSSWYSPWRCAVERGQNIFEPIACRSFWFQNVPLEDYCNNGWLALSKWP